MTDESAAYNTPQVFQAYIRSEGEAKMELTEAIQKRVTIRRWKETPVEKEKIIKVLEAGRRAPSWGNVQPWRFIVVQDKKKIEELASIAGGGQPQVSSAPAVIVCCGQYEVFSRKMHRESLKQLIEAGVMDWPDEVLDDMVLGNSGGVVIGAIDVTVNSGGTPTSGRILVYDIS